MRAFKPFFRSVCVSSPFIALSAVLQPSNDHNQFGITGSNVNNSQKRTIIHEKSSKKEEMVSPSAEYLAEFIDHTVLKPNVNQKAIENVCNEAMEHGFFSVCINPTWVTYAAQLLKDSNVKVCTVIGFPLGANTTVIKVAEAIQAIADGANEVDMVMNVGFAKSGNWNLLENDIKNVVRAVKTLNSNALVKVILETCLLTENEVQEACRCAVRAGADFVKTSTGFSTAGATLQNIRLMRETVDEECVRIGGKAGDVKIKASGGIRNTEKAQAMIAAGADRIGASSGIKIIGTVIDRAQTLLRVANESISQVNQY